MTLTAQSVLTELDARLPQASPSWRGAALRQIADLFLAGADLYTDEQVALFDEVMGRLIPNTDRVLVAELSSRLAGLDKAPGKAIGTLARHPDISVCGPILEQAKALPDADLVAIADEDRKDLNLLVKIAARPQLSTAVTDVLLKRGHKAIQRTIIDNPNAHMSEAGFARVIMGLNGDKDLAAAIAARDDVPPELRVWLTKTLEQ
jgi:uncharacterized protein (DUF2336 family)